jgi:hypothetical protein
VGYYWWDEQELPAVEEGGPQYSYLMIKFTSACSRSELIQRVVRLSFPTYDSEIAALANADPDHAACRLAAKEIADEIIASY